MDIRKIIREEIEKIMNERGLAFNEKTLTPRSDGSYLPHHSPVTTNLEHPNRKNRFKSSKKKKKINEVSDEQYDLISSRYSDKRIILSNDEEINFVSKKNDQRVTYKPKGLWYGFGNSWADWVISEMPEWRKDYKSIFLLEINESSILKMSTKEELLDFTKKYSPKEISNYFEGNMIDWGLVVNDYDGIEINPYIYSARMDEKTSWYYTWDVASGCIWNVGGIKSIKKIG